MGGEAASEEKPEEPKQPEQPEIPEQPEQPVVPTEETRMADGGEVRFVQEYGQYYEAHFFATVGEAALSFADTTKESVEADILVVGEGAGGNTSNSSGPDMGGIGGGTNTQGTNGGASSIGTVTVAPGVIQVMPKTAVPTVQAGVAAQGLLRTALREPPPGATIYWGMMAAPPPVMAEAEVREALAETRQALMPEPAVRAGNRSRMMAGHGWKRLPVRLSFRAAAEEVRPPGRRKAGAG